MSNRCSIWVIEKDKTYSLDSVLWLRVGFFFSYIGWFEQLIAKGSLTLEFNEGASFIYTPLHTYMQEHKYALPHTYSHSILTYTHIDRSTHIQGPGHPEKWRDLETESQRQRCLSPSAGFAPGGLFPSTYFPSFLCFPPWFFSPHGKLPSNYM